MGRAVGRVASGIGLILVLLGVFVPGAGAASSPPGPPTISSVITGTSRGTVNFDPPADDGGSPIDSYLASCTSSDGGVGNTRTGGISPIVVTGLTPGKIYTCVVAATSVAGQGADSAPSDEFVPLDNTVPAKPSIELVNAPDRTAAVTVHAPDDDGGTPITQYGASCTSTDFGAGANATSLTTPVMVGLLTNNASYTCTATVANNVGTSEASDPWGPFTVPPSTVTGAISGTVTTNPPATLSGYCAEATETWGNGSLQTTTITGDGTYTLTGLADHEYAVRFVDCTGGGDYLPRWYGGGLVTPNNNADQDGALPVSVVNGGTTSGIDGVLSLGAHMTGTVTDSDDNPLEHVCAAALANTGPQAITNTAADGTYDVLAPPGTLTVGFFDCSGSDVVTQFWDHVNVQADATQLTVTAGSTTHGIDAEMTHGGRVVGTVTDATTHDPLEHVCVTAWNATGNASNRTDSDGQYELGALPPGIYRASFVDCAEHPTHGGTTRSGVFVVSQNTTTLDVELSNAAPGTIAGHLTTEFGTPLEGACVAVLGGLSGEPRFAGPTGPDGAYEVDELGTGSYFVGFFGCNTENPSAPVLDPAHQGTTYHAQWYSNAWLGQSPDPFGDGATPIEIVSDQTTVVDECFDDCNNTIRITGATTGNHTITLDFRSTVPGAPVTQSAQALPEYVATCTSSDGGATGEASSNTSPIAIADLTNGSTYACLVATTIGDTTYESAAATSLVPQGADLPAPAPEPAPESAPSPAPTPLAGTGSVAPTSPELAVTGAAETMRLGIVGLSMVLVGAAAVLVARRRRPERA